MNLKALALTGTLALGIAGCDDPKVHSYQEGTVFKESGTLPSFVQSNGALLGNESVRIESPTYVLSVQTANGNYIFNVDESRNKPLAALEEAIEIGDTVRFSTGWRYKRASGNENYFPHKDNIGKVPSEHVELIAKKG